jgi:hypothetical protein
MFSICMFDTQQISGRKLHQAALYKHKCNQLEKEDFDKQASVYHVKQSNDMVSRPWRKEA